MNILLLIFILMFALLVVPILIWGYQKAGTLKRKDIVFYGIVIVWGLALAFGIDWSVSATIADQGVVINTVMIILMAILVFAQYHCEKFCAWLDTVIYKKNKN